MGLCENKTIITTFFEIGQRKINFSLFELSLPDDDPVYTLKNVMEVMYAVVTYANMRGGRAVDRIVDLCHRDLAFIWRSSINYHLAGLLDTIDTLYTKYNAFLLENG